MGRAKEGSRNCGCDTVVEARSEGCAMQTMQTIDDRLAGQKAGAWVLVDFEERPPC